MARRGGSTLRRTLRQLIFGVACAAVFVGGREIVNLFVANAGPYSLIFPAIMFATLYGRWPAGLVCWTITFFWTWYQVLPPVHSFAFDDPTDWPRTVLNATSGLLVLLFAEIFRSAVERASNERDEEIERRHRAMLELGHRTKNNFALVASLLQIQKKQENDERVTHTLDAAIGRVHSFAEAYEYLQDDGFEHGLEVEMQPYLTQLTRTIAPALFDERVSVDCSIADIRLPKDKAVALGLVLNEALTNAAKYAFPNDRRGKVRVRLSENPDEWLFDVDDDGVGRSTGAPKGSGLGAGLMEAFAKQASAELSVETLEQGTRLRLRAARV